jgi:hypothetical protein
MSMHRAPLHSLVALVVLLASASMVPAPLAAQQGPVVLPIADAKERQAVERVIAQAEAKGLPVQPLISKAMEGVTKQASGSAIRMAVTSQAERLEQARALLAPSPSVAEMVSGADALKNGVPPAMLKRIRAAWPRSQSVVMPLDVLTELVARGIKPNQALDQITTLMASGATPSHIAGLGASVQSDVAAGLAPDAALEVRARGVMSLLPSPAVQAAGAPRGKSPK